jgi:pimeloyl-ACP methyl ester carboxylesterase
VLANVVPALATERWMETLRGYFTSRILDPQDPPELTAHVMAGLDRARPEFAHSFFASLFASDWAEDVENAPCPLLYIHAKVPADLQRLAQLRPDALIGQVIASGHFLTLTAPEQVNAILDRFLELVEEQQG